MRAENAAPGRQPPPGLAGAGRRRLVAALLAWLLLGLLSLVLYAAPRWVGHWVAEHEVALAPETFSVQGGTLESVDDAASVAIPAGAGRVIVWTDGPWDATQLRYLDLRLDGPDDTHDVRLLWRADGKPRSAALARVHGRTTLDMPRVSEHWKGSIGDLAIAISPANILPPDAASATGMTLNQVSLRSDAWLPAVAALLDEWSARRIWTGRSINTSGLELGYFAPRPWLPWLALNGALLWLLLGMARRWSRSAWIRGAAMMGLSLWLLLDMQQIQLQWQRTMRVAALHSAVGDDALQAMPALATPLLELRQQLLTEQPPPTVFLDTSDAFLRDYPMYLLRPLNVGPLPGRTSRPLAEGVVVLQFGKRDRSGSKTVVVAGHRYRWTAVEAAPELGAWRVGKNVPGSRTRADNGGHRSEDKARSTQPEARE